MGVLSVAKRISTVQPFVERSQKKILRRSALLLTLSLLIGLAFAYWLTHSLRKLQRHAASVEAGEKVELSKLGNDEIGNLGRALDTMRNKLGGKEYVEGVMHTLAHGLRSPIAAIQGSAELIMEDMPEKDRSRLPVHPVQYFLVGLALALFFLLLLSLSEHLAFILAYAIASVACIVLIAFYLADVLLSWKRGFGFGAALTALYGVPYVPLQSENNALVMGSILLFAVLAISMIPTRKTDWYRVGKFTPTS